MSTAHQPTRYSVDAVKLKEEIESNLVLLRMIRDNNELDALGDMHMTDVIASHEQQLAQINEDLLNNKII